MVLTVLLRSIKNKQQQKNIIKVFILSYIIHFYKNMRRLLVRTSYDLP